MKRKAEKNRERAREGHDVLKEGGLLNFYCTTELSW